jgi:solute carrier family 35 (UDP-xylose/UDP-N-acetylglucosamine transporter), member B4
VEHFLSLPIFLFLVKDIKQGLSSLSTKSELATAPNPYAILILGANLISQLICVSGVNRLSSVCVILLHSFYFIFISLTSHVTLQQVSSVSTNLVLTTRKAISLCFSVWWFGNGWNLQLGVGAGMVFAGSLLFTAQVETIDSGDKQKKSE